MKNQFESEIFPAFSTPIYKSNAKYYSNNVVDFNNINFDEFYWNGCHPNENVDGQILVTKNQNILLDDKFADIKKYCDKCINQYVYDILQVSDEINLKLVCSWMIIGYPGSVTNRHLHQNSVFSGIFYVKSEENSGELTLIHPFSLPTSFTSTITPTFKEFNILNCKMFSLSPKTNDIIIFPSHLYHEVSKNISKEVRCCIAFNYFLDGIISNDKTEILNLTINSYE